MAAPLRIMLCGGPRMHSFAGFLEGFTLETGMAVEVVAQPDPERLHDTALDLLRDRAPVHVISSRSEYTAEFAPELLPCAALIATEHRRDLVPDAAALCSVDRELFQAPWSIEPTLLFYRTDLLDDRREKQGFAAATGGRGLTAPRSWEDLAAVAQFFTRGDRLFGFTHAGRGAGLVHLFATIVTAVGGTFLHPDGTPAFFSRAGEWALQLLHDLATRWNAVPPETPDCEEDDVSELFRLGRAALAIDVPHTARLLADPTFSSVAGWHSPGPMPMGAGGGASWTGCPTMAIPSSCPDRQAAGEWLDYVLRQNCQLKLAGEGAISSRSTVRAIYRDGLFEGTLSEVRFRLAEQALACHGLSAPPVPTFHRQTEAIWPVLQSGITGQVSVADCLRRAEQACGTAAAGEEPTNP